MNPELTTRIYRGWMEAAALTSPGTRRAVLGIAALVLVCDQASKSLVVVAAPGRGGGGLVSVGLVRNTGASFGIGAGHPVLVTLAAAAVFAVAAVLLARARSRAVTLFLAAVLGGTVGNLADRLLRSPGFGRGAVVDWIHLAGYTATFNIADAAIRLGATGALAAALGAWPHSGRRQAAIRVLTQPGPGSAERPGRSVGKPGARNDAGGHGLSCQDGRSEH